MRARARIVGGAVLTAVATLNAQTGVNLSVSKTAPSTVDVGVNFNYIVTVLNNGPDTATGTTMTDVLPPGVNFVPAGSTNTCVGNGSVVTGVTVTCFLGGILPPNSLFNVVIVASATSSAVGAVTNVAGAVANEFDADMTNNSATAVTSVGGGTPPPVPTGLVANATLTTQVTLAWNASPGATSYVVERSSLLANYGQIGTSPTNGFVDNTAVSGVAYLYQVKAVSSGGTSAASNRDLATTVIFGDDPLNPVGQPRTTVKALHFTQLKQAINAVQVAANQSASSWTQSTPAVGGVISKIHMENLRSWIVPARMALGFSDPAFGEPDLTAKTVKKDHVDELRSRVK